MLSYYAFKIPFKTPFRVSSQTLTSRNGILMVFDSGSFLAFGEIAPLPGFSKESIDEVLPVLVENHKHLESAFQNDEAEQLISILDAIHQFPSLSFGLDTLMLDTKSKKNGHSLAQSIFDKSGKSINVNGAVGIQDLNSGLKRAEELVESGIGTLKVKVGLDHQQEVNLINAMRSNFPDVNIRIDANQAWKTDEAINCLADFSEFEIEYCEQPVHESDIQAMKSVKDKTEIPIAADESVRNYDQARQLIDTKACDILILKPSLFGRIKNCIVTKEWAVSHNIDVVVTTAFDSIIGRTITAVLASGLGSQKFAHGLATGQFLNEPGNLPKEISEGSYLLPSKPGLGHHIDLSYFKKIL